MAARKRVKKPGITNLEIDIPEGFETPLMGEEIQELGIYALVPIRRKLLVGFREVVNYNLTDNHIELIQKQLEKYYSPFIHKKFTLLTPDTGEDTYSAHILVIDHFKIDTTHTPYLTNDYVIMIADNAFANKLNLYKRSNFLSDYKLLFAIGSPHMTYGNNSTIQVQSYVFRKLHKTII